MRRSRKKRGRACHLPLPPGQRHGPAAQPSSLLVVPLPFIHLHEHHSTYKHVLCYVKGMLWPISPAATAAAPPPPGPYSPCCCACSAAAAVGPGT